MRAAIGRASAASEADQYKVMRYHAGQAGVRSSRERNYGEEADVSRNYVG